LLHHGQLPASVASLLNICQDVLTIVPPPQLDIVHALDWYYEPPTAGTSSWRKRAAGRLVNGCKYDKGSDPDSIDICGRTLAGALAAMIDRHPLLSAVTAVVAVPGHDSKVTSTSRRLARTLAQHHLGLPLVPVYTHSNVRQKSKDSTAAQLFALRHDYHIPESLACHTVLVVDDVVRTGGTMDSVGWALRRAGAAAVFGIAGAKTRRNSAG
jgi:predicted amidophosphoribosyltransferase